jgi:hypothetical protein
VRSLVEQNREAEMLQTNGRLGLIHREKRKTGLHPAQHPLDIRVDELATLSTDVWNWHQA